MRFRIMWFCAAALGARLIAQSDWPAYGGDPGNTRYSLLKQINPKNVSTLAQAWIYDTRPDSAGPARRLAQTTPLVVSGVMYFVTAYQSLVAVNPESGKPIWTYSHQHTGRPPRGIAYWPGDRGHGPEILFGTGDGFLIAVNTLTGKPVPGFEIGR